MTSTNATIQAANFAQPNMQFYGGTGVKVMEITNDGSIIFNPELSVDEAAKGVMDAIEKMGRPSYPRRVQDLLETNTLYLIRARTAEELLTEALDRLEPQNRDDMDFIERARAILKGV